MEIRTRRAPCRQTLQAAPQAGLCRPRGVACQGARRACACAFSTRRRCGRNRYVRRTARGRRDRLFVRTACSLSRPAKFDAAFVGTALSHRIDGSNAFWTFDVAQAVKGALRTPLVIRAASDGFGLRPRASATAIEPGCSSSTTASSALGTSRASATRPTRRRSRALRCPVPASSGQQKTAAGRGGLYASSA